MKHFRNILMLFGLLQAATTGAAQNYRTDWYAITGGAGTSTGGVYSLSATIGQLEANQQSMTGANVSLTGGFWSLFAVQTADAPRLAIQLTATNTARVSWPSPSAGFVLQQNTDLNTTNWVAPSESIADNGAIKFIIVSPPTGHRFYRVFKP